MNPVLASGHFYIAVNATVDYGRPSEDMLFNLIQQKADAAHGFKWIATQEEIAKRFKVDPRTVRRWISNLRQRMLIMTEYVYGDKGWKKATIFSVAQWRKVKDRLAAQSLQDGENPDKSSEKNHYTTSSLRSEVGAQAKPEACSVETKTSPQVTPKLNPKAQTSVVDSASKKINGEEAVTKRLSDARVGTYNPARVVDSNQEVSSTPTQQVLAWWLANRNRRPHDGEIAAMGRAVKKCLTIRTIDQVKLELQALMRTGRDHALLLEVRVGFVPRYSSRRGRRYVRNTVPPRPSWKPAATSTMSTSTPVLPSQSENSSTSYASFGEDDVDPARFLSATIMPNAKERAAELLGELLANFSAPLVARAA